MFKITCPVFSVANTIFQHEKIILLLSATIILQCFSLIYKINSVMKCFFNGYFSFHVRSMENLNDKYL